MTTTQHLVGRLAAFDFLGGHHVGVIVSASGAWATVAIGGVCIAQLLSDLWIATK